jgi:hypothetical protein
MSHTAKVSNILGIMTEKIYFCTMDLKHKKWINRLWLGLLLVFPWVLIILPYDQFDTGPVMCLFTRITGSHCMGCGMTRSVMRVMHFRFAEAWEFNRLIVVVFPVLVYLWFDWVIKAYRSIKMK